MSKVTHCSFWSHNKIKTGGRACVQVALALNLVTIERIGEPSITRAHRVMVKKDSFPRPADVSGGQYATDGCRCNAHVDG